MKTFQSITDVRTWVANAFPYMSNKQVERVTDKLHSQIFERRLQWGEDWTDFIESITVQQADEWAGSHIPTGYVLTNSGEYYVQKADKNQWGFTLFSDDKAYPGGFGVHVWHLVSDDDVPAEVKERLGFLLDD